MSVTQEDTFDCVVRLVGEGFRPVALDFASGTNPGGGWRQSKHRGTQEESLCQRSDLGLLLEKRKYPIPNDSYHYIPKVTITSNKICCAIIASELRSVACHNAEYLANRIIALYECALKNKHDAIVLGAWGCGAFLKKMLSLWQIFFVRLKRHIEIGSGQFMRSCMKLITNYSKK